MTDSSSAPSSTASTDNVHDAVTPANRNRSTTPVSDRFRDYVSTGWAERSHPLPAERAQAAFAAKRRDVVSRSHPGQRIVFPAGPAKVRSNDTDFPYRAHSDFAYLTGWGADSMPGSVLVLEPDGDGHSVTLYFREAAGRDTDEFYANPEIGEFWTGARPSLDQVAADLGLRTAGLDALDAALAASDATTLVIRDVDPATTADLDARRAVVHRTPTVNGVTHENDAPAVGDVPAANDSPPAGGVPAANDHAPDLDLARELSELRLVKDEFEIAELDAAVAATRLGFDDVIADLASIAAHPRGERLVEGTFDRRARAEGNTVGYGTIAASGPHACILHWTRNDGPVVPGDLILIDAGVELESYYTADITRTLPVNGTFTAVQRRVYDAVLEAADAAFAIVRPGIRFREVHAAAMGVIARVTAEWGLLPVTAEQSLEPDNQYHRRYMVHGTSHHLGLDVHDCAQARREFYLDGVLEPGMVFTIEPGLYFQPDDLTVPEELRGIGVRIEDNILVTESGARNLSIGIPRTADAVEAWLAR